MKVEGERRGKGRKERVKTVGLTSEAVRRQEKRLVDHPSKVKERKNLVHMCIIVHDRTNITPKTLTRLT